MREIFFHRAYKRQPTFLEVVIFKILATHFPTSKISKMLQVSSMKVRYFGRKHNIKFTYRQFNTLKNLYEASGPFGLLPDAKVQTLIHDMIFLGKLDFDVAVKDQRVVLYGQKVKRIRDKQRLVKLRESADIACFVDPYLNH